jgi:molybdopterin-containing oxidoreductase family membrane subunit
VSALGTLWLGVTVTYTVVTGIGVWGNNIPVAWAYAIINFVWWIGIGHAGTFISAFLLLLNQRWRASVNRIAEAMTLFALVNAGLFPLLHLGRPWFFYWLLPYPTRMSVWPQFKSALPWDVAAVATYFTVSLLFWYLGLVPDLATARDTAPTVRRRKVYGIFALGWRGSAQQWQHYRIAYLLLAGVATPLVISVHSVVSLDFSISQLPGWHSTIFPPYFVVGAIYSGFAMVLILLLPVRRVFGLEDIITRRHLDNMAKLLLTTGLMLAYSYIVEVFIAWYSGDLYERYTYLTARPLGPYSVIFWAMIAANVLTPQLFWFRRLRTSVPVLFAASLVILAGMWTERFIIIVTSLNRDFLPSSWHYYTPTWVDWSILLGTVSFFSLLFLLFIRFVPFVALHEMKQLRYELWGGA